MTDPQRPQSGDAGGSTAAPGTGAVHAPVRRDEVLPARAAAAWSAVGRVRSSPAPKAAAIVRVAAELARHPAVLAAASAVGSQLTLAVARRLLQPVRRPAPPPMLVVSVSTRFVALSERREAPQVLPRRALPPGGG